MSAIHERYPPRVPARPVKNIAPAFVFEPLAEASDHVRLRSGQPASLSRTFFNTGAADIGVTVWLSGSAITVRLVTIAEAKLTIPRRDFVVAVPTAREGVLRADLFEPGPNPTSPPPNIVPAGFDLPPPFLCTERERPEAEDVWADRRLTITISLMPTAPGRGELELRLQPQMDFEDGSASTQLEIEIDPV